MRAKNRGMNMTEEDIMDMIAKKKERYARPSTNTYGRFKAQYEL